jgi:hypothetical protein
LDGVNFDQFVGGWEMGSVYSPWSQHKFSDVVGDPFISANNPPRFSKGCS